MCRWLAYSGPSLPLSTLLTRPSHSLIDQSRHATHNVESLNGDGFGVGWYDENPTPGVYRDTYPAWNDRNFQHLSEHIESSLFLAHVRASTGTAVQNTNCHPFSHENWLFQHNGSVPEFRSLKRQFAFDVAPELFPDIEGSTDSELLFFLALTFGLKDDAPAALSRMVGYVEQARKSAGINAPLYFSACTTDGERLWAVRYSSNNDSRTLFHSSHLHALHDLDGTYGSLPPHATIVVSEPLDDLTQNWQEVPESSLLTVEAGKATVSRFTPAMSN